MSDQIILEQIDIMVVGPKKYRFLQLVLEKNFDYPEENSSTQSNPHQASAYVKLLQKFFTLSTSSQQNTSNSQSIKSTSQLPSSSKDLAQKQTDYTSLSEEGSSTPLKLKSYCGIQKFTKMIQTESFWITLNFFVTDLKIYDPILSEYTRGNIQIGIVVGDDESGSMEELKTYFSAGNHSSGSLLQNIREPQKNARAQNTIEAKVNSRIHTPYINGFSSLLSLKLRDEHRLVEESNNLRLNNNQIFRWIVDRYFESKYRIKLKEELGDEIQKGGVTKEEQTPGKCQIM